ASQCQISTSAPASGTQLLPLAFCRLIVRSNGTPGRATPVPGSVRISERKSFSSTQYGPSVTCGVVATQAAVVAAFAFSNEPRITEEAPAPNSTSASRRPSECMFQGTDLRA